MTQPAVERTAAARLQDFPRRAADRAGQRANTYGFSGGSAATSGALPSGFPA
jgi:hypothetical protein